MAVTKTNFINYTRCKRYVALEEIKKEKLLSDMSIEEYLKEELEEETKEILLQIYEQNGEEEIDKTLKKDIQLEAMMPFYKEAEELAGKYVSEKFGGTTVYSEDTFRQESFDFCKNGIRYLCYVDIYNETEEEINIIEVKSTTSKKYIDMTYGIRGGEKYPLFIKKDDIYHISPCIDEIVFENYKAKKDKLKNRYSDVGKYIFDLAVQRYIIENDLRKSGNKKKVNYYLAVLNTNYVYDGKKINGKRVYEKDKNGNEIISLFNLSDITLIMQAYVDKERINLENYLLEMDNHSVDLGLSCQYKKNTECMFKPICFKKVPSKNSSFNYLNFKTFENPRGQKLNKYDLINYGFYKMDDIPREWLKNPNHIIQRDCYDNDDIYVNKEKIKAAIENLEYPIYHLDFETLPCPLPRFFGEKPYTQSVFEFSLHIEREPGVCDKEKDNIVYIAKSSDDEREALTKLLCENIDVSKGTMLAQNVSFERARIFELADLFPQYREHLLKINMMSYDLLYIIRNNKKLYQDLGFDKEEVDKINYYNKELSGSYSIKKTLPVFTDLKYTDLEIQNGTQALVEYSKYPLMDESQLKRTIVALIEYCKQDTWAMVEILRGLRKLVN